MPKPLSYKEVVRRLKDYDGRFEVFVRKGKGSHRTVYHPDIKGRTASYPLKYHGAKTSLGAGYLNDMIRRFNLPQDFFDHTKKERGRNVEDE